MSDPVTSLAVPWRSILTAGNAAVSVVRQSRWLAETWRAFTLHIGPTIGRGYDIAFVGSKGVGKTTLFDGLCGAAAQAGYSLPDASFLPESTVTTLGQALALTVIPGDQIHTRDVAIRSAVVNNPDLRVLVLVVCDGLAKIRDDAVRRTLLGRGVGLASLRESQRAEELAELGRIGEALKLAKRDTPLKLIIAVNKADLWWPELDRVYGYYDRSGTGEFAVRLAELQAHVGRKNLTVQTLPTVAWSEDFDWGDEQVPVTLRNEVDRRLLQQSFVRALS
jgi:hypothetical protein